MALSAPLKCLDESSARDASFHPDETAASTAQGALKSMRLGTGTPKSRERGTSRQLQPTAVGERDMIEWVTRTPDGLVLRVRRENRAWLVRCGGLDEARSELLDVALFEAIRGSSVIAHSAQVEYGAWIRELANE